MAPRLSIRRPLVIWRLRYMTRHRLIEKLLEPEFPGRDELRRATEVECTDVDSGIIQALLHVTERSTRRRY